MNHLHKELQAILNHAYPEIGKQYKIEFKNFFGAVAGYINDNIFCSYGKFGFALKLSQKNIDVLMKKGGTPLQYFPKGHVKRDYVVLPEGMLHKQKQLKELIIASIAFVR